MGDAIGSRFSHLDQHMVSEKSYLGFSPLGVICFDVADICFYLFLCIIDLSHLSYFTECNVQYIHRDITQHVERTRLEVSKTSILA